MKQYEEVTILGLFWAGYWRFSLIIGGIWLVIWLVSVGILVALD